MTLNDLSLHYQLVTELNNARDRLSAMNSFLKAQSLDGMPRSSGESRKVEQLSILISQQSDEVARMERVVSRSEKPVREFIEAIQDNLVRQVCSLHFLAGYEWPAVAAIIGGRNTTESVKSACYRYMRRESSQ